MRFEEKLVTPQQAKQWLSERAEGNRDISSSVVENYAHQMKEGWWTELSPEPISFRIGDGKLIDGQHRLAAIVKANVSIKMGILWDAPSESFKNLNAGHPRNIAFRTHTLPFATQCYGILLNMTRGASRLVASEVELMNNSLNCYVEMLKDSTFGKVSFFGSAPIRAAALVSLALHENPDYILKTYKLLSTGDANGISPVGQAFMTQFHRNTLIPKGSRGGAYSRALYFRSRYVFDYRNANVGNLPDDYKNIFERYQSETQNIVKHAFGEHFNFSNPKISKAQRKLGKVIHNESAHKKFTKQLGKILEAEQAKLSMLSKD